MKKALIAVLTITWFASTSFAHWRNQSDFRSGSTVFSQFKYFSFYSEKVSGHLAYVQLSPEHLNKFYVSAFFVIDGVQHTMFQTMSGDCVRRDQISILVDVCGKAGIVQDGAQAMTIYNSLGKIRWNLKAHKSSEFGRVPRYDLQFENSKVFEKLLPFDWSISWQPMDLSMRLDGMVWIEGQAVEIRNQTTYHDDTWGNWNFLTQPYFWIYFASPENSQKNIKLILGDFYFNKADRFMGITVYIDGEPIRYLPQEYTVSILKTEPTSGVNINLMKNQESYQVTTMESLKRAKATHQYPSKIRVETKDGKVKLNVDVRYILPYAAKVSVAKNIYGPSWHDEMVIDVSYEITDRAGTLLRGNALGGMEFFQTKAIGLPLKF